MLHINKDVSLPDYAHLFFIFPPALKSLHMLGRNCRLLTLSWLITTTMAWQQAGRYTSINTILIPFSPVLFFLLNKSCLTEWQHGSDLLTAQFVKFKYALNMLLDLCMLVFAFPNSPSLFFLVGHKLAWLYVAKSLGQVQGQTSPFFLIP